MGGPIRNPKKPIEETEASAILTLLGSVVLPTVPYMVGITEETPKPTNINPIELTTKCGYTVATIKPSVTTNPLNTNCFLAPQ